MSTFRQKMMKKYAKMLEEEEKGNFLIPNGIYKVVVTDTGTMPYRSLAGNMISITFEVVGTEYEGKRIYENYNLEHPTSANANKFGYFSLVRLAKSAGMRPEDVKNIDMFLNKTLKVKVGSEKSEKYGASNVISEYITDNPSSELTNEKEPPLSKKKVDDSSEDFEDSNIADIDMDNKIPW